MDRIYAVSAAHRDASNDEATATTTHETRYYVVNGRAGAQVRRTMSLQSARVAILDAGVVVASDKETTLEDGKLRIHVVAPREEAHQLPSWEGHASTYENSRHRFFFALASSSSRRMEQTRERSLLVI